MLQIVTTPNEDAGNMLDDEVEPEEDEDEEMEEEESEN